MSLASSSSFEPPSNRKEKGNKHRPYKMYPSKAKLELSKYNGSDDQCVSWLNKAEEYFKICNIQSHKEKVKYALMHMEGYAYNWYLWWRRDNFTYTWNFFKNDFFNRFQGIKEDEFFSKLTILQQVGSVEEFTHHWESYRHEYLGCLTNKDSKTI